MADTSEEKSEQPTQKKLRDARKKGQIAHSKDAVSVAATTASFAYFFLGWDLFITRFDALFSAPGDAIALPFDEAWPMVFGKALELAILITAPFVLIAIMVSFIANIIVNKGMVFAGEPIKPTFDKINPVKGFKRLFSMKTLLELVKSLFKILVLTLFAIIVLRWGTDSIVKSVQCGVDCVAGLFGALVLPFMAAVILFFVAIAFLDYFLQENLFKREMKMTKTEVKREHKEQEGDPLIKGMRRQLAHQFLLQNQVAGAANATFLVTDGDICAVGLRYVEGETQVPILVAKGRGVQAEQVFEAAAPANPLRSDRPNLAHALFERGRMDEPIPAEFLDEVATALGAAMALRGQSGS